MAKLSISRARPYQPLVQLAALLSGLPAAVIEQIDPEDFKPISSYVSGFLL
ncbi:MAG: phage tail assembly protein [Alphaproteobacteria bacterium]|nr:phage tail assembly protein [Alphaproteobacteria bacterium]